MEKSNIRIRYILVFIIIQSLDLLTTIVGIKYFGMWEINPIMAQFTLLQMSLLKILAVLFVSVLLYAFKKIPEWAYIVLILISSIPIPFNMFQIALETLSILSKIAS